MSENSYVVRQNGVIVAILCKGCGQPIRGLVPYGEPIHTRKKGDMVIRDNYLVLGVGPNYTEVEIEVERDGKKGKHVTCLCKGCANNLDEVKLNKIYAADMDELESEGQNVKELRKWKPRRLGEKVR